MRGFFFLILIVCLLASSACTSVQAAKPESEQAVSRLKLDPVAARTAPRLPFRVTPIGQGAAGTADILSTPAAEDPNPDPRSLERRPHPDMALELGLFKGFFVDLGSLITSPLRWDTKDWLTLAAVGGATAGLTFLDGEVNELFLDNPSDLRKDFLKPGEIIGDGGYAAASLAGFYLLGMGFKNEELKSTTLLAGESLLITAGFTQALKHLTSRARPRTNGDPNDWEGPFAGTSSHRAFPSGHTSTAFSIATVFATQYERHVWMPPLAYGLATMAALSRVNEQQHWLSDVFFGAALGYFTSKALYKLHTQPDSPKIALRPWSGPGEGGVNVDWRF